MWAVPNQFMKNPLFQETIHETSKASFNGAKPTSNTMPVLTTFLLYDGGMIHVKEYSFLRAFFFERFLALTEVFW